MLLAMTDEATIDWYDREANRYVVQMAKPALQALSTGMLLPFLDRLAPGAAVLELGCGGGRDTLTMLERGFRVTPTDGSPAMAREAEALTGQPVQVLRFTDLDLANSHDAVWAHAALHHQPFAGLGAVLARIHRALRPGGWFFANYKLGAGEERDALGRLYSFPPRADLLATYQQPAWAELLLHDYRAGGADGVERDWIAVTARKPG